MNESTITQTVLFADLADRPVIATFDQPHASSDGEPQPASVPRDAFRHTRRRKISAHAGEEAGIDVAAAPSSGAPGMGLAAKILGWAGMAGSQF